MPYCTTFRALEDDPQFKEWQFSHMQETVYHTSRMSYDRGSKEAAIWCIYGHWEPGVFVDTKRSVCCAWAMPVYTSVKVNSGAQTQFS